ncbi:MAG: GerAB/ArcD/ProY family transporter [Solirubrobacterales bacterium]
MNKSEYGLLSSSEVTCLMVGTMVGIGALILPNDVMSTSKQDGWISVFLGAVYPLLVMLLSRYIFKNYPEANILDLSRKFFGKFLGNVLNFIFAFQFIAIGTAMAAGYSNLLRMYIVIFLDPMQIYIITFILGAYASGKGLKALARVNELIFVLTVFMVILPIVGIKEGSILNVSPILGSGVKNIILGSKETIFAYAPVEAILLIPAFIRDKNKITGAFFKAILITALIYTWITFITIYYLGVDIIPKCLWAFVSVTDSVKVPFVTSFRFIFMFLWSIILFKTFSNQYYYTTFIISDVTRIKRKIINVCILPFLMYLSTLYGNEAQRRKIASEIVPKLFLFNILFIVTIVLIIFIKKVLKNEKDNIPEV